MKVVLSLHDFSVLNNRLDLLWRLREYFPDFKASLFTVPDDIKHKTGNREEALVRVKECLDWMQIIPHGYQHNSSEAKKWSYVQFINEVVPAIIHAFQTDGLPFVEGFSPPHWDWNEEVVAALNDLGWWGEVSPKRPDMIVPKRFYKNMYSIDDFPLETDFLKLTGHINGTSPDDLETCLDNLFRLPKDTSFRYVTDFIETQ